MSLRALDPVAMAKASPYYARNHMGKTMCNLCNVVCTDEPHFLAHLEGKRHSSELEGRDRRDAKRKRLQQEEEEFEAAKVRAEASKAADRLMASGGARISLAPHGKPKHTFRTETNPETQTCKVWLEFYFNVVPEDTRPLHRWRSSREVSDEPEDDVVFLIVACEGYESIALKFPKLARTTEVDADNGQYSCRWDPLKKVYTLYFVMG
jgi:hypothetical protein